MEKKQIFSLGYHVAEKERHAEAARELKQHTPNPEAAEKTYSDRYTAMIKRLMPLFIFERETDSDKTYPPRFTPIVPVTREVDGEVQRLGIFFRFGKYDGNIVANICFWPEDTSPANGHIPSLHTESFDPGIAELLDQNDRHDWFECDALEVTIEEYLEALRALSIEEAAELGFPKKFIKSLPSREDKQLDIEEEVPGLLA